MKKIFNQITILIFFLTTISCSNTIDDVKKGLGGGKRTTTDEFLVRKKDPLAMPPKWDDLPEPGKSLIVDEQMEEIFDIEELIQLGKEEKNMTNTEQGANLEESFLKKIKKN